MHIQIKGIPNFYISKLIRKTKRIYSDNIFDIKVSYINILPKDKYNKIKDFNTLNFVSIISKKIHKKSSKRNLIRRRIKSCITELLKNKNIRLNGLYFITIKSPDILNISFYQLSQILKEAFTIKNNKKLNLIKSFNNI